MAYLSGTPEQLAAWGNQARQLYAVESLVIIGSIARTAMYAHFGWQTEPLALEERQPHPPFELELRDFDGVFPLDIGGAGPSLC